VALLKGNYKTVVRCFYSRHNLPFTLAKPVFLSLLAVTQFSCGPWSKDKNMLEYNI